MKYTRNIDQLCFCSDIETKLEVKDTSHSEQNLPLHPIPHIIEPNQSNQTTTFFFLIGIHTMQG